MEESILTFFVINRSYMFSQTGPAGSNCLKEHTNKQSNVLVPNLGAVWQTVKGAFELFRYF